MNPPTRHNEDNEGQEDVLLLHDDDDNREPAAAAAETTEEEGENHPPMDDANVTPLLDHYVRAAPGWRTRRRRRRSVEACATDLLQRLQAASDELYQALTSRNSAGLTLPLTALSWILAWQGSSRRSSSTIHPLLLAPWLHDTAYRHQWQALLQHWRTRLQQIRLVGNDHAPDSWPPRRQSRATTRPLAFDNAPQAAAAWLQAYHAWQSQRRQTVDLTGLVGLRLVWLQGVAPAQVVLPRHLPVWRLQGTACPTLAPLVLRHAEPIATTDTTLANLTYLRINHCNLLRLTMPSGGSHGPATVVQPMLPRSCPNLRILHLAHNGLTDDAITEAGLDQLVYLEKVDLSYNYLRGLWNCGPLNWQQLNLAHNEISTVGKGVLCLYGLTTLDLSHNFLRFASRVVGIVHLPLLQELTLEGNPLARSTSTTTSTYRDLLWDLFRQARNDDAAALPRIDGHRPSLGATSSSWNRPWQSLVLPAPLPVVRSSSRSEQIHWDDSETETQTVNSPPARSRNDTGIPSKILVNFDAWQLLESLPSTIIQPVENDPPVPVEEDLPGDDSNEWDQRKVVETNESQYKESEIQEETTTEINTSTSSAGAVDVPERVEATCALVASSEPLVAEEETSHREKVIEEKCKEPESANTTVHTIESTDNSKDALVDQETNNATSGCTISMGASEPTTNLTDSGNTENLANGSPPTQDSVISASHVGLKDPTDGSATNLSTPTSARRPPAGDSVTPLLKKSSSSVSASTSEAREGPRTPASFTLPLSPGRPTDPSPSSLGSPYRTSFHVAFPDHVWQDEANSIAQSSTAMSYPDTVGSGLEEVKAYETAEAKSTFVGPQMYNSLIIRENLELYFRLFVFSQAVQNAPSFLDCSMDSDWQSILELYPRIQLWPIDRRLRDATTPDLSVGTTPSYESFRRVWTENVVACGKPALRRLTPNLTARLGFHGELMWSSNAVHLRQEAVSTHRLVILCLSSAAFYVILDHDAVTEKAKGEKRRFPLPLPSDACFADAKWPHALARHPFSMLRKVIIGFGFQRLTLRFSNSSFPSPEDFTYIMLTCNKLTTVSILKDIQEIVAEAKQASGFDQLAIENDDVQVLEALGKAVAPDLIGVVFHYQILEQRWKHGDRPNVRRALLITDTKAYLLDEDYLGDGAKRDTTMKVAPEDLALPVYRLVDSAFLGQIGQLHTGTDPSMITLVIRPTSRLSRIRNWRLVCRDRQGKERLVEDIQKAIGSTT